MSPSSAAVHDAVEAVSELHAPLSEITRVLTIHKLPASTVLAQVNRYADDNGQLSKNRFIAAFQRFLVSQTPSYRERAEVLLTHLFNLFDLDGNGVVDAGELLAGLSVLCGGTRDDKVETAFMAYDLNHDGFVSLEEVRVCTRAPSGVVSGCRCESRYRRGSLRGCVISGQGVPYRDIVVAVSQRALQLNCSGRCCNLIPCSNAS